MLQITTKYKTIILFAHLSFLLLYQLTNSIFKGICYLLTNFLAIYFYYIQNKEFQINYIKNISKRIFKYYACFVIFHTSRHFFRDDIQKIMLIILIVFFVVDSIRVFFYEKMRSNFYEKMINEFEIIIFQFEYILKHICNGNVQIPHFSTLEKDVMLKNFIKHFVYELRYENMKNDRISIEELFEIFQGKKLLNKNDTIIECNDIFGSAENSSFEMESDDIVEYVADHTPNDNVNSSLPTNKDDIINDLNDSCEKEVGPYTAQQDVEDPNRITRSSIKINFPEKEAQDLIWNVFKMYDETELIFKHFKILWSHWNTERRNLKNSLDCFRTIFLYLNYSLISIEVFLVCMCILKCLGIEMRMMTVFFSILIFTLSSSIKSCFDSLLSMIINYPYNCGDRIYWKKENYIVKRIGLLFTILEKWDGQYTTVLNLVMIDSPVFNAKRNNYQKWEMELHVDKKSLKKMQLIESAFGIFCKSETSGVADYIFSIDGLEDNKVVKYRLVISHKNNFQSGYFMWKIHNRYTRVLRKMMIKQRVRYFLVPKTLSLI